VKETYVRHARPAACHADDSLANAESDEVTGKSQLIGIFAIVLIINNEGVVMRLGKFIQSF
jgi:hypothetical protein